MQKYSYDNKELDASIDCYVDDKNDIWFRGRDIANILNYKNPQKAIRDHVDSEDKILLDFKLSINSKTKSIFADAIEKTFKCFFINETGFHSLLFSSKKQEAKEIKHWVTKKVLPLVRKRIYQKQFNDRNNNMILIENENDLHCKIVSFIRKKYEDALMIAGLGENQISSNMRIKSYNKGYMSGQCDLMLMNPTKEYNALCLEFKSPTGVYQVTDKQKSMKQMYEKNKCKYIMSNCFEDLIYEITKHMEESKLYLSRIGKN